MIRIAIAAALAFATTLPAIPAQAAAARTFLSAAGSDANNCTNVATPCRHMAAAFAATAADGEIYVFDPANYGSLTITHGVSIEGHGWASIAPPSGGNAITINANQGDAINIIGVVLDGTAIANTTGIAFNSGGTLTVRDSVIRNFGNYGIDFEPTTLSQLYMSNTLLSNSGNLGIRIVPQNSGMNGVLNHVEMINNAAGALIVFANGGNINFTVSDSVIANNGTSLLDAGITAGSGGGVAIVALRNSTIANNANYGLLAENPGTVLSVTRSTITGNGTGWVNLDGGVVSTFGDNDIFGNGSANNAPTSVSHE